MITINRKQYRNQAEQILKNKEDIADFTSINGLLGIKIVGVVTEDSPLPAEDSEVFASLEYGDAYIEDLDPEEADTNYIFYVKTRPNDTVDYDHWFELKLTGIQGPQGIQGVQGVQGIDGTYWSVSASQPANPRVNDIYMNPSTGSVYVYNGTAWQLSGNIKGAQGAQGIQGETGATGQQGAQGPKGERGDPGAFIHIVGKLNSESLLPSPADIRDLSHAYLVKQASPSTAYDLYVQIGADFATAQWDNIGPLNVATYVTVGGEFVGQWNADTKLDKVTSGLGGMAVYGYSGGEQQMFTLNGGTTGNSIPLRTADGHVRSALAVDDTSDPFTSSQCLTLAWWRTNMTKVVRLG